MNYESDEIDFSVKAMLIPVSVQCEVSCCHRGVLHKSADSVPAAAPSYDREVLVGDPAFVNINISHTCSHVLCLTPVSASLLSFLCSRPSCACVSAAVLMGVLVANCWKGFISHRC